MCMVSRSRATSPTSRSGTPSDVVDTPVGHYIQARPVRIRTWLQGIFLPVITAGIIYGIGVTLTGLTEHQTIIKGLTEAKARFDTLETKTLMQDPRLFNVEVEVKAQGRL